MTHRILPIDVEDMREMRAEGLGYRRIARRMGISREAVREHLSGKRTATVPKWMLIQSDVAALKANGLKVKEMARYLGVSPCTVRRAMDERHRDNLNKRWKQGWHARRVAAEEG